jgi:hypothetical protein
MGHLIILEGFMLKKLFLAGIILSLFSVIGCSEEQGEGKASGSTAEVKVDTNEIESLQTQIQFLEERNQYLVTTINNEEMLQFSKDQISYKLGVNGEPIPRNGHLIVDAGSVEILLTESDLGHDFLPDKWSDKGKISGDYIDHLLHIDTANWIPVGTDGTVNTARGFQSADIQAGQQFSFNITEELRERLEIDTNLIQVKVK